MSHHRPRCLHHRHSQNALHCCRTDLNREAADQVEGPRVRAGRGERQQLWALKAGPQLTAQSSEEQIGARGSAGQGSLA